MCQFLSAIAFADGDVYTNDATDSHEHLIAALDLDDSGDIEKNKWCRVEYTTEESKDLVDITKYQLKIDQELPAWATGELREKWERKLRTRAKAAILTTGKKKILLGGKWVVGAGAEVERLVDANVVCLCGTVQKVLDGGTVQEVLDGGTVQEVLDGGTVQEVLRGGTVQKVLHGGTVQEVLDGGTVQEVLRGGTVQKVYGGKIINDYRRQINPNPCKGMQ